MSRRRPRYQAELLAAAAIILIFVSPLICLGLYSIWISFLAGYQERDLAAATKAAYAGSARVDLELARKALASGDVTRGEARISSAQDRLSSPLLKEPPADVERDVNAIEQAHASDFKPVRRERALKRLGREGAEVRASAVPQ